mgnify:CR=1 FL=1
MEQIIRRIYEQAKLLGVCTLFTGKERTLEDIVRLFVTPQGIEFCINNHFPNMATLCLFKSYKVERFGIYIDAGTIELHNPSRAILIGRTSATVKCDTLEMHDIILLHGAKAIVNASGWAVCKTTVEAGCSIIRNTSENAVIL